MLELSQEDRERVLGDYQRAAHSMATILAAKLSFWSVLPWKLCGLLHTQEAVAREGAFESVRLFDSSPDGCQHHRLTVRCLAAQSPIRAEIIRFAQGAALHTLAKEALAVLLPLRFLPTVERVIESKHAGVATQLSGKKRNRAPCQRQSSHLAGYMNYRHAWQESLGC